MSDTENQSVFSRIYDEKIWGQDGGGSGRGSTVENAARTRSILNDIVDRHSIKSLLDAPCGAMVWTRGFLEERHRLDPDFRYHGVDVVESVVQENIRTFDPDIARFDQVDLAWQSPPSGYDLILCRDTLQHLSYASIAGVLRGFLNTGSPLLLTTSFNRNASQSPETNPNTDIKSGGFFRVDLLSEPFNFKTGLLESHEDHRPSGFQKGHELLLFDLVALGQSKPFEDFLSAHTR